MKVLTEKKIAEFREYLITEEKSKVTLEKYIRDVNAFMGWVDGREVDKTLVLKYKDVLIESYAPTSVNSILSSLNSLFCFLEWFDCKVKTIKIQRQIFAPSDRELTREEYGRLLRAAEHVSNKRLYYLIQTICATGIRVSELKYITVEAVRKGAADVNCKCKRRKVWLPRQLCEMLRKYISEKHIHKGSVFVSRSGRPLDRSNIWKMLKALCEKAGVSRDKVFPHNLRHLFARTHYSIQKDIIRLADILGHSSVNTTRIYTIESGEVHRQQVQQLGLLRY